MSKKLYFAVIGAAVVSLAVACVSASGSPSTPLYMVRMEQASSKMNFLPTTMNEFAYTAESAYTLDFNVSGRGTVLSITEATTNPTYITCLYTCPDTCHTCLQTCPHTCIETCPNTCDTCLPMCGPEP